VLRQAVEAADVEHVRATGRRRHGPRHDDHVIG
jgi:hypothetical protein